jgi:AcrR family transcriptional regulator
MSDSPSEPTSGRGQRRAAQGRRSRKKRRTREEIRGAALALFAERGFEAVTLDQICESADVARGTFFLHFASKGALLRELDRELARELTDLRVEPRGSALAEYRMLVDRFFETWPRRAGLRVDLLAAVLREGLAASPEPPVPPGDASAGRPDLRGAIEDIVRRGQQRGELRRNVSPGLAATSFLATAATLLAERDARGPEAPERLRNELLHVFLHGVAEGKPRVKWSPTAPARPASPPTDA